MTDHTRALAPLLVNASRYEWHSSLIDHIASCTLWEMLPPLSPSLFEQNPKFKALYNDLKIGRLNEDGSTKVIKKQRAQDELRKVRTHCKGLPILNGDQSKADHPVETAHC